MSTPSPAPDAWAVADANTLTSLLSLAAKTNRDGPVWRLGVVPANNEAILAGAARKVAQASMSLRCGAATHLFDAWLANSRFDTLPAPSIRQALRAFVAPGYGLPSTPRSPDHVQGHVGEIVWYTLLKEATESHRQLLHLEAPGFQVTAPGGDGLAVYDHGGTLHFRLWEMKKHTRAGSISSTTTGAFKQLNRKAPQYLAQYTSTGASHSGDLASFYAQLVEMWLGQSPRAGAGVAVATSASSAPRRCFSRMSRHLGGLPAAQLEGLVSAIGDFAAFATSVQQITWNGL